MPCYEAAQESYVQFLKIIDKRYGRDDFVFGEQGMSHISGGSILFWQPGDNEEQA